MITKEKRGQSRRLWLAWALWAFWTTDESLQFLRLLNPQKSWRELCLSFETFVNLPEEVMEELYARLHQRGSSLECKSPAILLDLCAALPAQVSETLVLG